MNIMYIAHNFFLSLGVWASVDKVNGESEDDSSNTSEHTPRYFLFAFDWINIPTRSSGHIFIIEKLTFIIALLKLRIVWLFKVFPEVHGSSLWLGCYILSLYDLRLTTNQIVSCFIFHWLWIDLWCIISFFILPLILYIFIFFISVYLVVFYCCFWHIL